MTPCECWQPDLYSFEFQNDPIATLNRLRAEDPVHRSRHGFWFLTRYEHVDAVLKDTERFSSAASGKGSSSASGAHDDHGGPGSRIVGKVGRAMARSFNYMDAPDHTRIRRLVHAAFTLRVAKTRHAGILTTIDAVMDRASGRERFDLVADIGVPIPFMVVSEIIGIPTEDRDMFRAALGASWNLVTPQRSKESCQATIAASRWTTRYLADIIAARRASPRPDLISDLIAVERDGDRLSDVELLAAIATIYTPAATTTERFVSSGLFLLLSHPEQWRALLEDRALMPGALEEILRFHNPTQSPATHRRCTVDVEIGGKILRAGETVRLGLGAANRDPDMFNDPDVFDIRRNASVTNLSLGRGAHFCIGAPLARYIGELTFARVMDRWPELRMTGAPVKDRAGPDRYREILVTP